MGAGWLGAAAWINSAVRTDQLTIRAGRRGHQVFKPPTCRPASTNIRSQPVEQSSRTGRTFGHLLRHPSGPQFRPNLPRQRLPRLQLGRPKFRVQFQIRLARLLLTIDLTDRPDDVPDKLPPRLEAPRTSSEPNALTSAWASACSSRSANGRTGCGGFVSSMGLTICAHWPMRSTTVSSRT